MRRLGTLLLAGGLFSLVFCPALLPATKGTGQVVGRVLHETERGTQPLARQPVMLYWYGHGLETSDSLQTTTNQSGRFSFQGLTTDSLYAYYLATTFQTVPYTSKAFRFTEAGQPVREKRLDLRVYDTTTDDAAVGVEVHQIVVRSEVTGLSFVEGLLLRNQGKKTVVAGPRPSSPDPYTLQFTLPAGVENFQIYPTLKRHLVMADSSHLYDLASLPPGKKVVTYSYQLPEPFSVFTWQRTLDYRTDLIALLVEEAGITVESPQLAFESRETVEGKNYLLLSAGDLAAGTVLDATFKAPVKGRPLGHWLVLLIGGMAALLLVYALIRYQKKGAPTKPYAPEELEEDPDALLQRKEAFLETIAELDDRFETGEVDEQTYRASRRRYKEQLLALARMLDGNKP